MTTPSFAIFGEAGDEASVAGGLAWLRSAEPTGKGAVIWIGALVDLNNPEFLRKHLGEAALKQLKKERKSVLRGRPVTLVTKADLGPGKGPISFGGPILAFWPSLENLRLIVKSARGAPIGVVAWDYKRDVAPLLAELGEDVDENDEGEDDDR